MLYKYKCSNCDYMFDLYANSIQEYINFQEQNSISCPYCGSKNINRDYSNINIGVIYKTMGFHQTDSVVEDKALNKLMRSDV